MTGTVLPALAYRRLRRAAWYRLLGRELAAAASVHWATQWYPGEALAAMQWEQVCALVAHARATSEFYQLRLEGAAVDPVLTPASFRRIPPFRRQDIEAFWAGKSGAAGNSGVLQRRSGGSSGEEVRIPLDRETYCWYIAGNLRGLRWWGADFTDRGAILLGSGGTGLSRLAVQVKDWAMNWLRIVVGDGFGEAADVALDRMAAFRPTFLYGYPSAVHRLVRAVRTREASWRGQLKVIVLTGEPVYAFQRRAIEETFACPVAEEYGNGEMGNMAFECPRGTLHATVENVLLEVQMPPAGNGDGGAILATQLRNRIFPMIRYHTGDWGTVTASACGCGRALPKLRIAGRAQEQLVNGHGSVLVRPRLESLFTGLPAHLQGAVQLVHRRPGAITCRVQRPRDASSDLGRVASLAAEIFGPEWRVDAVEVARFSRLPSGKLPYFVSLQADDDSPVHHE